MSCCSRIYYPKEFKVSYKQEGVAQDRDICKKLYKDINQLPKFYHPQESTAVRKNGLFEIVTSARNSSTDITCYQDVIYKNITTAGCSIPHDFVLCNTTVQKTEIFVQDFKILTEGQQWTLTC